jgi:hypothetical protein
MNRTRVDQTRKLSIIAAWALFSLLVYLLSLGPFYAAGRYGAFQSISTATNLYWWPSRAISRVPLLRSAMEGYVDFWLVITDAPDTTF